MSIAYCSFYTIIITITITDDNSTVISACGSRSSFQRMRNLGWIDPLYNYSADSMDMNASEDAIVHHTRLVAPSLVMGGCEVAYLDGLHLPGPTSGCLIQSGWKASSLALESLNEYRERKKMRKIAYETASHFLGNFNIHNTIISSNDKCIISGAKV